MENIDQSKIICYYHTDHDGHASGMIIKTKYPNAKMIEIDYDEIVANGFSFDSIDKNTTVFMVDFSLQPFKLMVELNEKCNLIWIDHHISAIEEMERYNIDFKGLQRVGLGALSLCFEYCYPDKELPKCLEYLAKYDVMKIDNDDILYFEIGLRSYPTNPKYIDNILNVWRPLLEPTDSTILTMDKVISEGKIIKQYLNESDKKYIKLGSHELEFEGLKCLGLNRILGSNIGNEDSIIDNSEYDAFVTYGKNKYNMWKVGMYTTKDNIDVGSICKKYGGGGHEQCGGFNIKKLPF